MKHLAEKVTTIIMVLSFLLPASIAIAQNQDGDQKAIDQLKLPQLPSAIKITGNADANYLNGKKNSFVPEGLFAVQNVRFFFDTELGKDIKVSTQPIMKEATFYMEWELYRSNLFTNRVAQAYVEFERLFDVEQINMRFGRFALPFGEEYVRWHEGRPDNPLISFSSPAVHGEDEGVMFFGSLFGNKLSYSLSASNGDLATNTNTDQDMNITGKLSLKPSDWFRASFSVLNSGRLGSPTSTASSALRFGEASVVPFGSGTTVVNFKDGAAIADDANGEIEKVGAWEGDINLKFWDFINIWAAMGKVKIQAESSATYDRELDYSIIEGVFDLGKLTGDLKSFYLAARYSAFGTFDSDEGYSTEAMNGGGNLGFNTEVASVFSIGIGIRLGDNVTLKTEYSRVDFDLVRGVTQAMKDFSEDRNFYATGITVKF